MRKIFAVIIMLAIVSVAALWAGNTSALSVGQMTFGTIITSHEFANSTGTIMCSDEIHNTYSIYIVINKESYEKS